MRLVIDDDIGASGYVTVLAKEHRDDDMHLFDAVIDEDVFDSFGEDALEALLEKHDVDVDVEGVDL